MRWENIMLNITNLCSFMVGGMKKAMGPSLDIYLEGIRKGDEKSKSGKGGTNLE
jgi:hypothetical protein